MIRSILTHTSTYNQNQPDFLLPQISMRNMPYQHFIPNSRKIVIIQENSRKSSKNRAFSARLGEISEFCDRFQPETRAESDVKF